MQRQAPSSVFLVPPRINLPDDSDDEPSSSSSSDDMNGPIALVDCNSVAVLQLAKIENVESITRSDGSQYFIVTADKPWKRIYQQVQNEFQLTEAQMQSLRMYLQDFEGTSYMWFPEEVPNSADYIVLTVCRTGSTDQLTWIPIHEFLKLRAAQSLLNEQVLANQRARKIAVLPNLAGIWKTLGLDAQIRRRALAIASLFRPRKRIVESRPLSVQTIADLPAESQRPPRPQSSTIRSLADQREGPERPIQMGPGLPLGGVPTRSRLSGRVPRRIRKWGQLGGNPNVSRLSGRVPRSKATDSRKRGRSPPRLSKGSTSPKRPTKRQRQTYK